MARKVLKCYTCGAPVASMESQTLDASTSFMVKKALGAVASMAGGIPGTFSLDAFLDPDSLAQTFALQCFACSPITEDE
jgi:hypothetical protein